MCIVVLSASTLPKTVGGERRGRHLAAQSALPVDLGAWLRML